MLAPIVLFTYNRIDHLRRTIESLQKNYLALESDLYIYSDGWKNIEDRIKVEEVRLYLKTITGFKSISIVEKDINCGLAPSLIAGITEILLINDKIIVVEDDLMTSPYALSFLNEALEIYKNDKNVATIHAHVENIKRLPDLFFYNKSGCLFWGTWSRAWKEVSFDGEQLLKQIILQKREKEFDFNGAYPYIQMLQNQIEGKINSWAIQVYASFFLKNMLTFYPGESLVQHIGYDGGTHFSSENKFSDLDGIITTKEIIAKRIPIEINIAAVKKTEIFFKRYFRKQNRITLKRVFRKLKKIANKIINYKLYKKVFFNNLQTIKPISNTFGYDRGTPIDRYYIEKFINYHKDIICGNVLEISESIYTRKYGFQNVKREILTFDNTNPNSTIIGDLTKKETLPHSNIDCFICTQTFNFIYDVKKAIDGAHYLLKENGKLLATVSGLAQISRYDMERWGDYWRFTDKSIKKLIEDSGFKDVETTVYGNLIASIALLQGIAVEDLPDSSLIDLVDNDYQVTIGIVAVK